MSSNTGRCHSLPFVNIPSTYPTAAFRYASASASHVAVPSAYSTIHHAAFVPWPYSRFNHSFRSFDDSFDLRTSSAHCSSDRPVFAGSSATHFWTIATLGWTSYADFFLAMAGHLGAERGT